MLRLPILPGMVLAWAANKGISAEANGYAERFVRTVRSELTDRMLIFNRRHLTAVMAEHVDHYNTQRPHRGQQPHPPRPQPIPFEPDGAAVYRHPILGGLINEYRHAA
jgi:putative transposase